MISRTIRLYPMRRQEAQLDEWLAISAAVWNWALARLIHTENEIRSRRENCSSLCRQVRGHGSRIGTGADVIHGVIRDLCRSWDSYRSGLRGKPRWRGTRNKLDSVRLRNNKGHGDLRLEGGRVRLPAFGFVRCGGYRSMPPGTIGQARLQRRPRGWYLTVIVDGATARIDVVGDDAVGVDLGFSTLAALSTGEKIEHPREYERIEKRLGQAQRGRNPRLYGRLQQSLALARRTRNHAVSRDLVSRFGAIYVSRDNLPAIARRFGKSVGSAGHGALLEMLASKCRQAGRVFLEVPSKNSTRTCSGCGALSGPTGLRGLSVRQWACACGAQHDRDVNAARNALFAGAVLALEMAGDRQSESESGIASATSQGTKPDRTADSPPERSPK